jgi:hypothetical protein
VAAPQPTDPLKSRRRRSEPPILAAFHAKTVGARGTEGNSYFVKCGECGLPRRHLSLGLRICPCGAHYRLVEGPVLS